MSDLTDMDRANLRRVRAIIHRLHHRERGQWGDPLDECLAALDKVIESPSSRPVLGIATEPSP